MLRSLLSPHLLAMLCLVVIDLMCGAGGTSTGAKLALDEKGLEALLFVLNHWGPAIETHSANHPKAIHRKLNIYRTNPRRLVPGGRADLIMASPTCTTFSRAAGGKPISWDQRWGRATPGQVLRWAKDLNATCLLIENVPEFADWAPLKRISGQGKKALWKPQAEKKGKLFRAWVRRLEQLGYRVEWRILNAADYGDATTRKRFFLLARKDGKPIVWPEATHAKRGSEELDLFAKNLKPWRAAREVIDWSILGTSIFDRKRPLAEKTLARIYVGMVKEQWPEIFLIAMQLYCEAIGAKLPEVDSIHARAAKATAGAFVFQMNQSRGRARGHRSVEEPLGTITATGTDLGLVRPFQVVLRRHADAKSVEEPIPTACAGGNHVGVVAPALTLPQHGGGAARPVSDPISTIATDGAIGLISPYHSASRARSVDHPLPTATTKDRFALVTPVTHVDGSNRSRSTDEPLPAVTAAPRGELAFIVGAFGERPGRMPRVHSIDEPAPTICARGRVTLVVGWIRAWGIDILFRMLEPHELAAATGFPASYVFVGNKTQKTRLIGNAVPVGMARALVRAIFSTPIVRHRGVRGPRRLVGAAA